MNNITDSELKLIEEVVREILDIRQELKNNALPTKVRGILEIAEERAVDRFHELI